MRDEICKECCPYGCDAHFEDIQKENERLRNALEWLRENIDSAYTLENIDNAMRASAVVHTK
jgi:hypothetical protein